jgi:glycopeptide antibiotics resistance protein
MQRYLEQLRIMIIEQTSGVYLMDLLGAAVITAILVLVPGYIVSRKRDIPYRRVLYLYVTLLYLEVLLFITLFQREAGSKSKEIVTYLQLGSVNGSRLSLRQSIYSFLNVVLFVPWGFLLYLGNGDKSVVKKLIITTLLGFLSSFSIECLQHITGRGFFEITDIVTNTTGTLMGALVCAWILMIYKGIFRK